MRVHDSSFGLTDSTGFSTYIVSPASTSPVSVT